MRKGQRRRGEGRKQGRVARSDTHKKKVKRREGIETEIKSRGKERNRAKYR